MTSATITNPHASRGLAANEVSAIKKAARAIPGWTAAPFDCACCGRTCVTVHPSCEALDGPSFEIMRDGSSVSVTTTWLDGEDYLAEYWSVKAAVGAVRIAIADTPQE